ncbi:glycosyltransferase [uncultured Roseobacter sp.]|uniref:glycosyltransferase family 4 protein n=1 Tax=uncultured Roseobacter sp. TaxID=114847 RepID=UPI002607A687|nr:glycosyltransferase [uncultured Roseobacter sp.]
MIAGTYTLFTRIPLYSGPGGTCYAGDLWEKDLSEHLSYIPGFRICCPVLPAEAAPGNIRPVSGLDSKDVIALAPDGGWGSVLRNLLPNFRRVLHAVRSTEIVHSGGAGWAFPLSYYIVLLRPFLSFKWIMVIESSFWMKAENQRPSLRQWASHHFNMAMVRHCLRHADAHIFTQKWYQDVLSDRDRGTPVHIAPAVWVSDVDILDPRAHANMQPKRQGPARLFFPARLVADKGVDTVLEAIRIFSCAQPAGSVPQLEITVMGTGDMAGTCRAFAQDPHSGVTVRFLPPVDYGAPFLSALRGYEAVIIANRKPEQPRIVFDAFSQGVPCIASKTPGIETLVSEQETGWLFEKDDARALADLFQKAVDAQQTLEDMGVQALAAAKNWTHTRMHEDRAAFLKEVLEL